MNSLFVVNMSVGLIGITAGLIYLWYLKKQNKYQNEVELAENHSRAIECRPERPSADVDLHRKVNDSFATKSDLEILSLKIENRFLIIQNKHERFLFILIITIIVLSFSV